MLMKFAETITDQQETNMPADEQEASADTPGKKAAKKRNMTAMYYFTLTFTTKALMGLIFKSYTTAWPSGLVAWMVV